MIYLAEFMPTTPPSTPESITKISIDAVCGVNTLPPEYTAQRHTNITEYSNAVIPPCSIPPRSIPRADTKQHKNTHTIDITEVAVRITARSGSIALHTAASNISSSAVDIQPKSNAFKIFLTLILPINFHSPSAYKRSPITTPLPVGMTRASREFTSYTAHNHQYE